MRCAGSLGRHPPWCARARLGSLVTLHKAPVLDLVHSLQAGRDLAWSLPPKSAVSCTMVSAHSIRIPTHRRAMSYNTLDKRLVLLALTFLAPRVTCGSDILTVAGGYSDGGGYHWTPGNSASPNVSLNCIRDGNTIIGRSISSKQSRNPANRRVLRSNSNS